MPNLRSTVLLSLLSVTLTTAHFTMNFPTSRNGDDDEDEATSPCGGYGLSSNRTTVSLPSFPVALEMGHDESVIQILLSLSSDPQSEDDFTITLERTFSQTGYGDFCLPDVTVPDDLGIKNGQNATLQVVTDGEGGGGLYVCADIIFSTTGISTPPSGCTNGTGVTASALPADSTINANESNAEGEAQSSSVSAGASASATTGSGNATSSSSSAPARAVDGLTSMAGWGVMALLVVSGVILL